MSDFEILLKAISDLRVLGVSEVTIPPTIWDLCWDEYRSMYPEPESKVLAAREFFYSSVAVKSAPR
jgi:hypothetical protein